jgi:hypothetical protein
MICAVNADQLRVRNRHRELARLIKWRSRIVQAVQDQRVWTSTAPFEFQKSFRTWVLESSTIYWQIQEVHEQRIAQGVYDG